jgi:hypothetical protein
MLGAGQRIVVAKNPTVFQATFGNGINLAPNGYGTANLSNGGERVALLGPSGETLQDFTYDDIAPWPTSPDGNGPTLEIISPLADPNNGANWRASAYNDGTPGAASPPLVPGDYNLNGTVDQADFNLWKATFGTTVFHGTGADGNNNGVVDSADFTVWQDNIGQSAPGSGGVVGGGGGSAVFAAPVGSSVVAEDSVALLAANVATVQQEPATRPAAVRRDRALAESTSRGDLLASVLHLGRHAFKSSVSSETSHQENPAGDAADCGHRVWDDHAWVRTLSRGL